MKYLYLLLLAFFSTHYSMEPAKPESDYEKARKFVYSKDGMHKKYYDASFELLEAIASKDTARIGKTIENFPKEGRAYLINAQADYHNISYNLQLQQKYPHFYAQKKEEKLPYLINPLAFAVYVGDQKAVALLHAHKVRMDFMIDRKCILEIAVECSSHLIPFLIACGAQVDANDNGALFAAARLDNVEAAGQLLNAGADLMARTKFHNLQLTPLHVAGNNGSYEVAKFFLENGAEVDATDPDGSTPLHWATMNRKSHIARLLLQHGANIAHQDNNGQTVIELLTYKFQYLDAVHFIKNGAPYPKTKEHQELIAASMESSLIFNSATYKKFVPAIIAGDTQTALTAINEASGNELNDARSTTDKYSFLHWATIRNNFAVVTELLNRRANQSSALRNTALTLPLISRIVQHPVNIDAQDSYGRTSLMWAARLGLKPIYDALKQAGADENLKDSEGKNAFLHAAQMGHMELALVSKPSQGLVHSLQDK